MAQLEHRAEPQTVEHRGCQLHYYKQGSGPPIVMIEGVGIEHCGSQLQVESLRSHWTCLCFDNRGIGKSQPQSTPITTAQMAEDVLAVMQAAGWGSAHLLGHSLGGMVAMQTALLAPNRVRSLTLICTFADGSRIAPLSPRLMWRMLRVKLGSRRMRRHGFLRIMFPAAYLAGQDLDQLAVRVGELFGHDLAEMPVVSYEQLAALRATNLTQQLSQLARLPALNLIGLRDLIVPPRLSREITAQMANCQQVEYPSASHGLPIQLANEVNAVIAEHLLAAERAWAARTDPVQPTAALTN